MKVSTTIYDYVITVYSLPLSHHDVLRLEAAVVDATHDTGKTYRSRDNTYYETRFTATLAFTETVAIWIRQHYPQFANAA